MSEATIVRKAGRPRKIRDEIRNELPITSTEEVQETPTISKGESKKLNFIRTIRKGKDPVYAFRGNEYLKKGENHYFVNGNPAVGYKLIRVYLNPRNRPHRSLERTLKPNKRTERGAIDRNTLKQLKTIGVSGIL